MKLHENLIYQETIFQIILKNIKHRLFSLLIKKSNNLFLRGGDVISISPQIFGIHEEPLTNLIKKFAKNGYKDFLIDIGANIGLTSCQNGNDFDEVHMYEPNPLCCNILEVNATIALNSTQFNIHKYGLGEVEKKVILTVPKHNWGGAFIKDSLNAYSDELLASKDCFTSIDKNNYFEMDILIKDTVSELNTLFQNLIQKGFKKGVIKIDVEGYELIVLLGIAKSLPPNISIFIVFESWDDNLDLNMVIDAFKGRCNVKKINRLIPWKKQWSKSRKFVSLLLNPIILTKITEIPDNNYVGDLILEIS